ncbi:S1C family serine protease [Acidisoma cladoniae]|jgi:S1-C subfamily serine protease|uniref:S1C family serine protease n=1 Tax=Acidisoma cladoniae TaxID=3040935 RepID=UPI00254C018F|nr:S1C family serine protease [Acidisoma sp. PAMC 29798]
MTKEPKIPAALQPDPADYAFDLETVLSSVVGLRAIIPQDAFTAPALGTEREGSGIVIGDDGLLLTMSYLIVEAETVWITAADGRTMPGHALAYDNATGFGLVQPLGKLTLPKLELGNSDAAATGQDALFASAGGRPAAIETKIASRQEFAGYWEYLLDDAIFTAPAHPFWGGGALIGKDGTLLGVGSLALQQSDAEGRRHDMNMIVPINLLHPILDALRQHGRANRTPRPYIGIYAAEDEETVVIGGVATGGPAEHAGLRKGDHVMAVEGEAITTLAELWRALWACGSPGGRITLAVQRDDQMRQVPIVTAEWHSMFKTPRMH